MATTNLNQPEKLSRLAPDATVDYPRESVSDYPEKIGQPEADFEKPIESQPQADTASAEQDLPGLAPQPTDQGVSIHPIPKSIALRKIESILEDDLSDIYFRLDEAHQRLFKEEGERAAKQIEVVLATGKSIAVKVLAIIKKWLQVIPGVNKFFIEQEAKIKTDEITRLNTGFPK